MAGQMILVGFAGDSPDDAHVQAITNKIAGGGVGGVMYLKHNVASLQAVRTMNAAFREAAPDGLPPLIALDQEGGSIERLTSDVGFDEIPSAAALGQGDPERAQVVYAGMAEDIAEQGFNLNFGPVVDLDINPDNPIIARYGRSYGTDAETVARFAAAFVAAHHRAGVLTALKHFPGHGSSTGDSHEGFVDVSATWQARELDPYRTLIARDQADMVMAGHLFHGKFVQGDARTPASLSPTWIAGVLRAQLGFDGVVISDDLEMAAIRKHYGFADAITRAVRAGTDILLFSNTADTRTGLADEVRAVLVDEAQRDPGFRDRIEQSYERIVELKRRLDG